ncbi:Metabotropic glutamate receptor 8 [Blattella germanica]|nr:Metabotropic glutamate receptor 8 [Blattella germanica]
MEMLEDGVQPLEAMLYTLQEINADPNLLPGIKLGMIAFDSCDSPAYGLQQSLDFVKGFIAHFNQYHEPEFACQDGSIPKFRGGGFDRVVAVVGGQSSSVTIQVAMMLRLFKVPQISYMATSPSLSDNERFPYFFRTVPSDVNQAHAMLEILREIQFVVVFADKSTTQKLMDAARRYGVVNRFVWIVCDAWSAASRSSGKKDESVLEGALAVQPLSRNLVGFDDYFKTLTLDHSDMNPWFNESLMEFCRRQGAHRRAALIRESGEETTKLPEVEAVTSAYDEDKEETSTSGFTSTLGLPEDCEWQEWKGYRQQRYLHFVRDAVYAIAHALHNMQEDLCDNKPGMCKNLTHIDGDMLKEYLQKVSFQDVGGKPFRFLEGRDGPPRYSILNFQKDNSERGYHWKVVGNYSLDEEGAPILNIDNNIISWRGGEDFPTSACATPCEPHQVKLQQQREDTCCWRCRNCGEYEYKVDDYRCEECAMGTLPSKDHSRCIPIPEEFIDYQNPWAIAAMGVASLGIMVTVFVLVIFWTYSDTPIVKASGRELSYLLLLGTLASFCLTFVIVAHPTPFTCGLTRFFLGFCYTLCYAAIVTKTNRIARIFTNRPTSPHKTRYTSPKSQLVITAMLTSVEIVINVSWLMYEPPSVTHSFPTRESRLLICEGLDDYSYMVGLLYPFVLIGFCTAYAVKTRKCPGGFNETRHIAFTNYTAIIIWLAFVPLYLASTSNSIRVVTLAISLSLSGLVQLGCLFFPKVYIVLFKPEKNTKEVVMSQHRSSSYLATPSNTTPVAVVVNTGGMHYVQNNDILHSEVSSMSTNTGSATAELNRKMAPQPQQQKLKDQFSPHSPRAWRTKPSPTGMRHNSPGHNLSSTSSIREEDTLDISERTSTKSSPA